MRAAVVEKFKEPLIIKEKETPAPGPDEVLLRVETCGVCHSDLHLADGDWPQMLKIIRTPLILGHEVVGRVVEKGASVEGLDVGDRAGVAWIHWSCGECEMCLEGRENLCAVQQITGATVDGGYAEFIKAKASHTIKVPENLTSQEAAPLFCAGVTVHRAIKQAGVRPGDRVAVFGIGGLGHLAVQLARTLGAQVIAADISEEKLVFARELGAEHTIDSSTPDAARAIRALGGAHTAVVTSAAKAAYDSALYALRPGGTLVVVGLPSEPLTFPALTIAGREAKIIASSVGTRDDLREVLELAAQGEIRCRVQAAPLDRVNDVLEEMRRGRITGRVVLQIA